MATNRSAANPSLLEDTSLRAEVQFLAAVTPENEVAIRTLHRTLGACRHVEVHQDYHGKEIWVIPAYENTIRLHDTHAGAREIHILPSSEIPPFNLPISRPDPLTRRINSRRLLRSEDLRRISVHFPGSVGVRVLICNFIIILFDSKRLMQICWGLGEVETVGGLRVRYSMLDYELTSDSIAGPNHPAVGAGYSVANRADTIESQGCLGLRLRMPSGQEAITVTTHAFVRCAVTKSPIRLRLSEWYLAARTALTSFKAVRRDPEAPAVVETRQQEGNTPLGKVVFLAGTSRRVGTITATYDAIPIPRFLPFPTGFRHDLSLITDQHLPRIINPPRTPRIIGWGEYSAVLDGEPVYICRFNAAASAWSPRGGQGVSRAAHAAIAAGAEYTWLQKAVKPTTALLWRTTYDQDSMAGFSGSVLCLGKVTDKTAYAVLFQNFQSPIKPQEVIHDHKAVTNIGHFATFKAGFLLPADIRAATIQMEDEQEMAVPASLNQTTRNSTEQGPSSRRNVTGPV